MLVPTPASSVTPAALLDRAALLSALDDARREVRQIETRESEAREIAAGADAVLDLIAERAMTLTGAAGAALALPTDDRMLCRARAGDPAPPLGSEVDVRAGLSGECIRSGLLVTCEDSETDPRVDPEVCRMLGIGSFMAAPIFKDFRVVGLLEIFSPHPHSFTRVQGTILERLVELVPESGQKSEQRKIDKTVREAKHDGAMGGPADGATSVPASQNEQSSPAAAPAVTQLEANAAVPTPNHPEVDAVVRASVQAAQQDLEDMPAAASPRRPRFAHLALLLLALGAVAMALGYLLAPTIEKHWPGLARSSQNSSPSSEQSSAQASSQSSPASSVSPEGAANRRGHALSPEDLRKLAEQGDADAQWQLGILYHDGDVIPKDDVQAVQWFQRAAEQGYVRAQSTLGAYYWAGRGVPQDFSKAYFWSQLALAQGDENSKSRLEGLSAQMTPSQVANARQQAEVWLHNHMQSSKPNPRSN